MSVVTLLDNIKFDNTGITGNGEHHLYISPKVTTGGQNDSLEAIITYKSNLPNPEVELAKYNLTCVIETEDAAGNWHPIHYQFIPFIKEESGNKHILKLNPKLFLIDQGVPNFMQSGDTVLAIVSPIQDSLPDDFRICIIVNERGFDGGANIGIFQEVFVTLSYREFIA